MRPTNKYLTLAFVMFALLAISSAPAFANVAPTHADLLFTHAPGAAQIVPPIMFAMPVSRLLADLPAPTCAPPEWGLGLPPCPPAPSCDTCGAWYNIRCWLNCTGRVTQHKRGPSVGMLHSPAEINDIGTSLYLLSNRTKGNRLPLPPLIN